MRSRLFVIAALLVLALVAGTGGVYAYDKGKQDRIAEGITVNGVPVGGMTAAQARERLRTALLAPLDRPVRVAYHGRRFTLTPRQAALGVDVDGSVARAVAASREGSMFSRAWREVRGKPLHENLEAQITWSRAALRRLVARVQRKLDRKPVDA